MLLLKSSLFLEGSLFPVFLSFQLASSIINFDCHKFVNFVLINSRSMVFILAKFQEIIVNNIYFYGFYGKKKKCCYGKSYLWNQRYPLTCVLYNSCYEKVCKTRHGKTPVLHYEYFSMKLAKFHKTIFLSNASSRLLL